MAPGSGVLEYFPDSTRDGLEEKVMGFVESNPEVSRTLKEGQGFFTDLMNSFQDLVLGMFDSKSLNTRNSMFAQIGVSSKGQPTGDNPFTAIDSKLGIQVSDQLQALCEEKIRDLAGWTGMSSKGAAKTVLEMEKSLQQSVFLALRDKYGNKQNSEQLQALAKTTAQAALGIDQETLASDDPAYWLAKSPPKGGIAGMIMGSAVANSGTAVALTLDSAALDKAVAELKTLQAPKHADAAGKDDTAKQQAAAALKEAQRLAAANQTTTPPGPGTSPGTPAPKPAPAPRVG